MTDPRFIDRPTSIALDALRGGAALAVFIAHSVQLGLYTGYWPYSAVFQHNAVMVFFVLSGLVITETTRARQGTLRDFAIARVARIMPLAVFALLFGLAAYGLGRWLELDVVWQGAENNEAGLAQVLLPLFFLSESAFGTGPVWNPPYWSLAYEVWYYALFAAAYFLHGWRRIVTLAIMLPLAGIKILVLVPVWLVGVGLSYYAPRTKYSGYALWAFLLAGIMIMVRAHHLLYDSGGILGSVIGRAGQNLRFSNVFLNDYLFSCGVALALIGLRGIAEHFSATLEKLRRPIQWLAGCSFTLYLLHWPFLTLLGGLGISAGDNLALFALYGTAIVAGCGQIAHLTEHRRANVRQWLAARFPSRRAAALPVVANSA